MFFLFLLALVFTPCPLFGAACPCVCLRLAPGAVPPSVPLLLLEFLACLVFLIPLVLLVLLVFLVEGFSVVFLDDDDDDDDDEEEEEMEREVTLERLL